MMGSGRPLTRDDRKLRAIRAKRRIAHRKVRRERDKELCAVPAGRDTERDKRATVERVMQQARQRLQQRAKK